jgi:hypothetical protein
MRIRTWTQVAEPYARCLLHRSLDRQQVSPVLWKKGRFEIHRANRCFDRDAAPPIACQPRGVVNLAYMFVGNRCEEKGSGPTPVDYIGMKFDARQKVTLAAHLLSGRRSGSAAGQLKCRLKKRIVRPQARSAASLL